MTKGEALQIVAATPEDELADTLLELACAMYLEEGHSTEDVLNMCALTLEDESE